MEYKPILLIVMGLIGVILHILMKLDSLNRKTDGNFKLSLFFRTEWISILISVIVVIATTMAAREIKQLAMVSNWLMLGQMSIGYMAQSLLVKLMGRANKLSDKILEDEKSNFNGI